MPAVPKLLHVPGRERIGKIFRDGNADERRRADGGIAKSGKVAVEKQIIENSGHDQIDPMMKMVVEQEVGIGQLKTKAAKELEFDEADEDAQQGTTDWNGDRPRFKTAPVVAIR